MPPPSDLRPGPARPTDPAPPGPGATIGKRELLQWASAVANRRVTTFEELKDGSLLLACMRRTWPRAYDACRVPRASASFETMGSMFEHLGLPRSVLDEKGIRAGSFRACYNFLVMTYFLRHLALHSDFSVDFTHPVDPKLAAFLQAPDSVASLAKGGGLGPVNATTSPNVAQPNAPRHHHHRDGTQRDGEREQRRQRGAGGGSGAGAPGSHGRTTTTETTTRPPLDRQASDAVGTRRHPTAPGAFASFSPAGDANDIVDGDAVIASAAAAAVKAEAALHGDHRRAPLRPGLTTPDASRPDRTTIPVRQKPGARGGSGTAKDRVASILGVARSAATRERQRPASDASGRHVSFSEPNVPAMDVDDADDDAGGRGGGMVYQPPRRVHETEPPSALAAAGIEATAHREALATPAGSHGPPPAAAPKPPASAPIDDPARFDDSRRPPAYSTTPVGSGTEVGRPPPMPLHASPFVGADGRVWLNETTAARGEAQLAEARFELEALRRLLEASRSERDLLARRYEVELDAARAGADADLRAARDAARAEVAARELQLAAERNADQRAFLHELRTVAEELAASHWADEAEEGSGLAGGTGASPQGRDGVNESAVSLARRRQRLEAVRGREIRALEDRVASLEAERERLSDALRATTRAATEVVFDDVDGGGVEHFADDGRKAAALAAALAEARERIAVLEDKLRVEEARAEADRASATRGMEELEQKCRKMSDAENALLRVTAAETDRRERRSRRRGVAPVHSPDKAARAGTSGGETYGALLKEQRDERRVVRLEAELYKARATNDALRRQMRALQAEAAAGGGVCDDDSEDDAVDKDGEGVVDGVTRPSGKENVASSNGVIGGGSMSAAGKLTRGNATGSARSFAAAEAAASAGADEDRLGAEGAADDAAELLGAIGSLHAAALRAGERSTERNGAKTPNLRAVAAAVNVAEAATWRRITAAAVLQRRLGRCRGDLGAAREALGRLERGVERERREWSAKRSASDAAAREAEDELIRERATGGVRTALAEEAERLAKAEAAEARADADMARGEAAAASGRGAGALREARDEVSKLRLRETHWVGLIDCHRDAAAISRELAELAARHGGPGARAALEAAAGSDLVARRAEMEEKAEAHVEAIKAVAAMLVVDPAVAAPCTAEELARERTRADALETQVEALRARLARKTEDAASLAIRAKRHELRAAEESDARRRVTAKSEDLAAELARAEAEAAAAASRAREEAASLRNQLDDARRALDDRDAALAVAAAATAPRRPSNDADAAADADVAADVTADVGADDNDTPMTRRTSPGIVAAAVAAATRAILSPTTSPISSSAAAANPPAAGVETAPVVLPSSPPPASSRSGTSSSGTSTPSPPVAAIAGSPRPDLPPGTTHDRHIDWRAVEEKMRDFSGRRGNVASSGCSGTAGSHTRRFAGHVSSSYDDHVAHDGGGGGNQGAYSPSESLGSSSSAPDPARTATDVHRSIMSGGGGDDDDDDAAASSVPVRRTEDSPDDDTQTDASPRPTPPRSWFGFSPRVPPPEVPTADGDAERVRVAVEEGHDPECEEGVAGVTGAEVSPKETPARRSSRGWFGLGRSPPSPAAETESSSAYDFAAPKSATTDGTGGVCASDGDGDNDAVARGASERGRKETTEAVDVEPEPEPSDAQTTEDEESLVTLPGPDQFMASAGAQRSWFDVLSPSQGSKKERAGG